MKLAQITFHNAQNCGAVLQAWALQTTLERFGHNVFLPDCNTVGAYLGHFKNINLDRSSLFNSIKWCIWYMVVELLSIGTDDLKNLRFKRFIRQHLRIKKCAATEVAKECDAAIFGSDQIWNPKWTGEESNHFLGECLPKEFPRIAYGISIGDAPLNSECAYRVANAAKQFDALSLREPLMQELLHDKYGRKPFLVCDPTLLLAKDDYLSITHPKRLMREPYLLFFSLRGNEFFEREVRKLANRLNLPCLIVNMTQHGLWRCRPNTKIAVSPELLLTYLRDAEYVITDSFHGTALAIIFGKKFLSIVENATPNGRIPNLLNEVGLQSRMTSENGLRYSLGILKTPLPPTSEQAVGKLRSRSQEWLRRALLSISE